MNLQALANRISDSLSFRLARLRGPAAMRAWHERRHFADRPVVHDLPPIFHYWSNRYLRPMFETFGFSSPDEFFRHHLARASQRVGDRPLRVASIGAGNGELECELVKALLRDGAADIRMDCIELNRDMIARGREHAEALGVEGQVRWVREDFNRWRGAAGRYDAIMANQSLHHVGALEHLFDAIADALAPGGCLLVSDMIGRNGHQRWPEALAAMQPFWDELPESYRYNHVMGEHEPRFVNRDCSEFSNEGIRAQDILPLLCERFQFELFLPYGNIVFPFVERPFGPNFDADAEWDRDFVDRLHARDEQGLLNGEWTPTSMLAVLRTEPVETRLRDSRLTPGACIRRP